MAKKIIIPFLFLSLFQGSFSIVIAQEPVKGILVKTIVFEGDTIPCAVLSTVTCYGQKVFKNKRDAAKWTRIKYNVKKVYPYAILAAAKLKEYDRLLAQIDSETEKKRYMKHAEEQLKAQFGEELKNLSISQGRILIKLIDRETGKTTYDVVKNMRGSFSAFMWQGVAVMFNSSLKADYDPQEDENDKMIEDAINLVEQGEF